MRKKKTNNDFRKAKQVIVPSQEDSSGKRPRKGIFSASKDLIKSNIDSILLPTSIIKSTGLLYNLDILKNNIKILVIEILNIKKLVEENKSNSFYKETCIEYLESINYEKINYENMKIEELEKMFEILKKEFYFKEFFLFTIGAKYSVKNISFSKYKDYKYD